MRYYWYFDANKFTVIDETGETIPSSVSVTVKYQQRAVDLIKSVEELAAPVLLSISDDGTIPDITEEMYVITVNPLTLLSGTEAIPIGEILYVDSSGILRRAVDNKNNAVSWSTISLDLQDPNVQKSLMKVSDTWDYQDDGYDSDVQLTATYYAASMLADMVPDGGQLVKSLFDRYRYRFKDLQIKHNAARYTGITIKPNHF
jgi:hypothetical protein